MARGLTLKGGRIFDGARLLDGAVVEVEGGVLTAIVPEAEAQRGREEIDLAGDILCPGYVDLQVNGGGGVLFNDDPAPETVERIAAAHRGLGVRAFLPTLITDTREATSAAIAAVAEVVRRGVPGVAGVHLEGPHLSLARKGAHDGALIRPMEQEDLELLLGAAQALPALMVTLAPENATEAQVRALAGAGALVSLGHTDADFDTCRRYFAAGARCATHLFNAMSQLGSRAPGLVGAALGDAAVSVGLIADGIHVHPETMRVAWASKAGEGRVFLVSDAMAVAGTDAAHFDLGGRRIVRREGRLTLADGTLAGADLDLTTAVRVSVEAVGIPLARALAAATAHPARLIGSDRGRLVPGRTALSDTIRVSTDLTRVSGWDGAAT